MGKINELPLDKGEGGILRSWTISAERAFLSQTIRGKRQLTDRWVLCLVWSDTKRTFKDELGRRTTVHENLSEMMDTALAIRVCIMGMPWLRFQLVLSEHCHSHGFVILDKLWQACFLLIVTFQFSCVHTREAKSMIRSLCDFDVVENIYIFLKFDIFIIVNLKRLGSAKTWSTIKV